MVFKKKYGLRYVLHVGWFILSIWMILGFLLSFALTFLSYHSVAGCQLFDDFLKNSDDFNSY